LRRDHELDGQISKLLGQVGAHVLAVPPEPNIVTCRSPDPALSYSRAGRRSILFTILQCYPRKPDRQLNNIGGALADRMTKFLLAEFQIKKGVHVLFQNTLPWSCSCVYFDDNDLEHLKQARFRFDASQENLLVYPPSQSCFFVLSSVNVHAHHYSRRALTRAVFHDFVISNQLNFLEED